MRTILFIVLLLLPAVSPALTPYTPEQPNPVLEPWRWRSLSSTREMFLRSMMETEDGHLWFGGPDGVIRYNGLLGIIYGEEDGLDGTPVVALNSSDGVPHGATSLGIHRLDDVSWERIFPGEGDQALLINDIATGVDGTVWASSAFGLFKVGTSGTTLYTTEELARHFEHIWPDVRYVSVPPHLAPATEVRYGSLGIQRSGDNVVWVIAGSPADSAGIRVGDRILDDRRNGGTIELGTRTGEGVVVIEVTDTGRGIAPENLPRIFDPGYTTKGVGVGVGLGLSTAYRIVQKHNGRIDVTSDPGRGSTFTVRIPLTS